MSTFFVHGARQLITLRGAPGPRRGPALNQLHIIEDGALLVEDGVIREVGPTRRLENLGAVRKAREISAAGRVVMPGFVDSHTHLISGPAVFGDGPHSRRSILENVPYVRETSSRRLGIEAGQVIQQSLAHGTTTLEAKSGYGLNASGELKILRALVGLGDGPVNVIPTFAAANALPPEFDGRPADYIRWLATELLPAVHRRGLARFVSGDCDSESLSAAELEPLYHAALELEMPVKLNLAQFGPAAATALLSRFPFASVDHLDYLDEAGAAAVAASGTVATLTPASSFFMRSPRYAPARDLIERGVPIALGSGFSRVTGPTFNMQMAVFLACRQMGLTPAEAISAATINSAHALKLGHRTGSLEAGKQADLVVLRAGDYRELACDFGINLVETVIRGGKVMVDSVGVQWPRAS